MEKIKVLSIIKYSIILILIPTFFISFFSGKIVVITALCFYPILIFTLAFWEKFRKIDFEGKKVINIFIAFNVIIFLRGVIDAHSSQDWIVLFSSTIFITLLYPLFIYWGNKRTVSILFKEYIKWGIPLSFWVLWNETPNAFDFVHTISGVYIFILFIPYLNRKWKIIIISLSFASLYLNMDRRSNMICILVAYLILGIYYIVKNDGVKQIIYLWSRRIFLLLPIIFLVLGLTGIFNIFKVSEFINIQYTIENMRKDVSRELLIDSRTSIYTDVFSELKERNAYIWGLGGSGKTPTSLTDVSYADFDTIYFEGRRATESSMLNYIQWGGLVGLLCYSLLFVKASFYAVFRSNNWFMRMLGVWVSFKYLYSFIEDRQFTNIYFFLIILSIGMCYNISFREMNDTEIKYYLRDIFTFSRKRNSYKGVK